MNLLKRLWRDNCGATLTTELVLLSTLTVGAIVSMAGDFRDGMQARVDGVISTLSHVAESHPEADEDVIQPDQCVVVADAFEEN